MDLPSKFCQLQPVFSELCSLLENTYGLGITRSIFSGKESFSSSFSYYEIDLCSSSIAVTYDKLTFSLSTKYNGTSIGSYIDINIVYLLGDDYSKFIEKCNTALTENLEMLEKLNTLHGLYKSMVGVCDKLSSNLDLKSICLCIDNGFSFVFDLCTCFICCAVTINGTYEIKALYNKDNKRLDITSFDFMRDKDYYVEESLLSESYRKETGIIYEKLCGFLESRLVSIRKKFKDATDSIVKCVKSNGNSVCLSISYKEWKSIIRCNNYQLIYDGYSIDWCEINPKPKSLCKSNNFGVVNDNDLKLVSTLIDK